MKTRYRVAGLVIDGGKLLLLQGKHESHWTPGGKIEPGESHLETLTREIAEETDTELVSATYFGEYEGLHPFRHDVTTKTAAYIVTIKGEARPAMEIRNCRWIARSEYEQGLIAVTPETHEMIGNLIKRGYY